LIGILVIAVITRLQRATANSRAARSRRRAAWSSRSVIHQTMIDLRDLLRDGRHKSAVERPCGPGDLSSAPRGIPAGPLAAPASQNDATNKNTHRVGVPG